MGEIIAKFEKNRGKTGVHEVWGVLNVRGTFSTDLSGTKIPDYMWYLDYYS